MESAVEIFLLPKMMTDPQTMVRLKMVDPASIAMIIAAIDSSVSESDGSIDTAAEHVNRI